MEDKSKLTAIILVIVTIIVVIVSFIFNNKKEIEENDISIVTNYSDFYTVNSCLYRTITYISTKDSKSLNLVLSNQYKKEKNVKEEDVLSIFESMEENSTFVSRKMYYQRLNDNIIKYFVYGYIEKNEIYDYDTSVNNKKKDLYFIVYLDRNNKTFAIEPYDGNIFEGGEQLEK